MSSHRWYGGETQLHWAGQAHLDGRKISHKAEIRDAGDRRPGKGTQDALPDAIEIPRTDHREEADGYRGEIFRRGNLRVAECRDRLQWLLQRRRPTPSAGGAAWRTLAYCVTQKALTRLYTAQAGAAAPELSRLPETIHKGKGQ